MTKRIKKPNKIYIFLLCLGLIIGFGIGIHFKSQIPKNQYSFRLNGSDVVVVKALNDYIEESINVLIDGNEIDESHIVIDGNLKDTIGTYIIKYHIKDIKELNDVVLQRIVIIVGEDVIGEETEKMTENENLEGMNHDK